MQELDLVWLQDRPLYHVDVVSEHVERFGPLWAAPKPQEIDAITDAFDSLPPIWGNTISLQKKEDDMNL